MADSLGAGDGNGARDVDPFGLVGQTLEGRYLIESVLAEGGFGVVYRATHRALGRPVAVKVLKTPPSLDLTLRGQFLAKFAQEAQLIARLDHPAIVRVLDFGASSMPRGESAPWMVLEWLDGAPLESDLQSRRGHGGRSPADALRLLRPVLDALAFAHDAGIAHRDLKPANLMMVRARQGDLTLRVLDFGIAKVMAVDEPEGASGQTATQSRLQAFTLLYAAPEQVSGTRTGPWTDVHALGLILTELLTDASAYPDQELTESYAAVLSPVRPTPARHGLDVGPWEAVLARAVAFRPGDRYQTAGELLRALEAVVPAAAPLVDRAEAVTTPRQRPPAAAATTLRPAEVRSQPVPIPRPRRGPLVGATGAVLALLIAGGASLSAGDSDILIASFSSTGTRRWSRRLGGPDQEGGNTLAVDALGNLLVAGTFSSEFNPGGGTLSSEGSADGFAISLTESGTFRWSRRFGGDGANYVFAAALDASGNSYLAGGFFGTWSIEGRTLSAGEMPQGYVTSFSPTGAPRWTTAFGAAGTDLGRAIAIDPAGNLYVTGEVQRTVDFGGGALAGLGGSDLFAMSLTSSGAHRWSRRYGGAQDDNGQDIAVTAGSVFIAGYGEGTPDLGVGLLGTADTSNVLLLALTQ